MIIGGSRRRSFNRYLFQRLLKVIRKKSLLLPTLLLTHEFVLIVLPVAPSVYLLLKQPTLYDGRALRSLTEHGSQHLMIMAVLGLACILIIVFALWRLVLCFRMYFRKNQANLAYHYFALFCINFLVIDTVAIASMFFGARPRIDVLGFGSQELTTTHTVNESGQLSIEGGLITSVSLMLVLYIGLALVFRYHGKKYSDQKDNKRVNADGELV